MPGTTRQWAVAQMPDPGCAHHHLLVPTIRVLSRSEWSSAAGRLPDGIPYIRITDHATMAASRNGNPAITAQMLYRQAPDVPPER